MGDWPFVRDVLIYQQVESTNDVARSLVDQGTDALPLVVWTRRQTQGRGRRNNSWWSDEGSLTFTIALDPICHGLRVEHEPRLALATAVAVIAAVAQLGVAAPGIGIRWPNDIEVGGRKLGGILPERFETARGRRVVIGIGLNVLSRLENAPPEIRRMAATLTELPQAGSLDDSVLPRFLGAILEQFERHLALLATDDPELAERWSKYDLLRGQWVRVALGPKTIEGTVEGIDPHGALWLHDGRERHGLFGGQVLRESPAADQPGPSD